MTYKKPTGLSDLSIRQIRARRRSLARLPDIEGVLQGSLQTQSRHCGKEGCRCTRGELHGPYTYLSVRTGGRSRLLYVPSELAEEVGRRVGLSERIQAALAEISAINLELLARGKLD
ncbi:MAG: DUF6788 family protein [Actinomycetota bacterium]